MTIVTDDLVVLPVRRAAEPYEATRRPMRRARTRLTLTDRLVAVCGVDRVLVDVAALERDLAALRSMA